MKELVLLVEPAREPAALSPKQVIAHWSAWEAPEGRISLSARLHADLVTIRAEHMAWAYDLGRLPVGRKETQARLKAGASLSMWWCSLLYERHPKMTPGLHVIYKLRALERLMDEQGFTALRLCGGDGVLRRSLADFCAASGRPFVAFHEPGPRMARAQSLLRRLYNACPAPLRAAARYAHWWWSVRRGLPGLRRRADSLPAPATGRRAATIATYFPNVDMRAAAEGRFRSRYWETLHDALNERARREGGQFVHWLFIRFPAPQLSFAQCRELRDRFRGEGLDGLSFHYLEEFLRHRDLWAALWRYLRLCWSSLRLEKHVRPAFHFAGSRLNFWACAKADWVESFRGWRGLERCLQDRAFRRYARWAGAQRWTLFPLENCPWERMLTQAMREAHGPNGGPVIGAQHSTIRPTDFRYFDDPRTFGARDCALFQPDVVRGNGGSACRQWLEAGMPPERLGEVEALRYLYLAGAPGRSESATATPARRLLVLTSFFSDETEAHLALLARAAHAGLLDGWELAVKPHPYLPVAERLRALLGRRMRDVRLADGPIADELRPGVLVWASNSTTAALDAALKGLPVMVMLPDDDFDLCPIQDAPGLLRTGSLEDVRLALSTAAPLRLPADYLNLDAALPRWRRLLGL
ncbi:TIGR04326 family surface carbohydrate biosynthesis protein [Desulfovibrio sp. SGI.169]|uniref:TIGR04326 family surface carbohydrate biosynthesis protein n=1 Tax=Desulfovibrio sp. SGI.169 TaxID=3420561 RepID=UPI003D08D4C8